MDTTDILFNIGSRVDDRVLLALFPVFETQIRTLISNDDFWYDRSRHVANRQLAHRQANWSRIYYALLGSSWGLDYLPSLLTIEEVRGNPQWTNREQIKILESISSPDVLDYIIQKGWIRIGKGGQSTDRVVSGLEAAAKKGWTQMLRPYYNLLKKVEKANGIIFYLLGVCKQAIESNQVEAVRLLIELILDTSAPIDSGSKSRFLLEAIENGSREMIEALLPLFSSLDEAKNRVEDLVRYASSEKTIQSLIDLDLMNIDEWKRDPTRAFVREAVGIIEYLLKHGLIREPHWNKELEAALARERTSDHFITYLLTKADPTANHYAAITIAYKRSRTSNNLDVLLADPRVNLRDIALNVIEFASYHRMDWEFDGSIDEDLYYFMVLKARSPGQILDWMIAKKDRIFGLASSTLYDGVWSTDFEAVKIELLLYRFTYRQMTRSEIEGEISKLPFTQAQTSQLKKLLRVYTKILDPTLSIGIDILDRS